MNIRTEADEKDFLNERYLLCGGECPHRPESFQLLPSLAADSVDVALEVTTFKELCYDVLVEYRYCAGVEAQFFVEEFHHALWQYHVANTHGRRYCS